MFVMCYELQDNIPSGAHARVRESRQNPLVQTDELMGKSTRLWGSPTRPDFETKFTY